MGLSSQMLALVLVACAVVSLAAGVWLIVHGASVAAVFRKRPEIAGPRRATQPKGRVWAALALFNLGWLAAAGIWTASILLVNNAAKEGDVATQPETNAL